MEETVLTCIECPMGCSIKVKKDNGTIVSIEGNSCPKGKAFAENETTCPKRVLTTTVRSVEGVMIPVKTDKPVRKDAIVSLAEKVADIKVNLPIKEGDVIVENFFEDANLVATDNADL